MYFFVHTMEAKWKLLCDDKQIYYTYILEENTMYIVIDQCILICFMYAQSK